MNTEKDYTKDLAEIRSMMERSSKFLSLSGWSGILAGVYALAGAWFSSFYYGFYPDELFYSTPYLSSIIPIALGVLVLALITAVFFSKRKAAQKGESAWNATSRRMLSNMAIPLITGGALIAIFVSKELVGLVPALMLIFYGFSLILGGHFTLREVRVMGFIQLFLGLLAAWFIEYSLIIWTIGFGLVHIGYGLYMHIKYER